MKSTKFSKSQRGVALLEYVLLLSWISVVVIAAVHEVGLKAFYDYQQVGQCLNDPDECMNSGPACTTGGTGCGGPAGP